MVRGYARLDSRQMDAIWDRLQAGHAAKPVARAMGLSTGTVRTYLLRCGGIRPSPRRRREGRLSLTEREEISRGLAAGWSLRLIAAELGRAPSTISREVAANGGWRRYRAVHADRAAWARATRPNDASWLSIRRCVTSWKPSWSPGGHRNKSPGGSRSPMPISRSFA